eukprot:206860_1
MSHKQARSKEYSYCREDCCCDFWDIFCPCFGFQKMGDKMDSPRVAATRSTRAMREVDKYVARYGLDPDRCCFGDVTTDDDLLKWLTENDRTDAQALVLFNETRRHDKEIFFSAKSYTAISRFLARNPEIQVFSLAGHPLNPETAPELARGLRDHPGITHVEFYDDDVTEEDAHYILSELVTCSNLRLVNFGENPLDATARNNIESRLKQHNIDIRVLW